VDGCLSAHCIGNWAIHVQRNVGGMEAPRFLWWRFSSPQQEKHSVQKSKSHGGTRLGNHGSCQSAAHRDGWTAAKRTAEEFASTANKTAVPLVGP